MLNHFKHNSNTLYNKKELKNIFFYNNDFQHSGKLITFDYFFFSPHNKPKNVLSTFSSRSHLLDRDRN